MQKQAPAYERGPIDRTGLSSQRFARAFADYALGRALLKKRADKVELGLPQLCRDVGGGGSPCFELPVYPRHEQHVTQSRLNRGGSGKQGFGKRVAQAAETHFVHGALLFEEIQGPARILSRSVAVRSSQVSVASMPLFPVI